MFTGIIKDFGEILEFHPGTDATLRIGTTMEMSKRTIGASVACNGICLTVTHSDATSFSVTASAETQARTTLSVWPPGKKLNLEAALRVGDPLDGHLIFGHIDTQATLKDRTPVGDSLAMIFLCPSDFMPLLAPKGSIAIDGVSLTVNSVTGQEFSIMLIPHSQSWTNLGALTIGDAVNLEADMLARYVARQRGWEAARV